VSLFGLQAQPLPELAKPLIRGLDSFVDPLRRTACNQIGKLIEAPTSAIERVVPAGIGSDEHQLAAALAPREPLRGPLEGAGCFLKQFLGPP
jgi:hypothetical protein